jgi:hypothetical protein
MKPWEYLKNTQEEVCKATGVSLNSLKHSLKEKIVENCSFHSK